MIELEFPSPTGVNHYEYELMDMKEEYWSSWFPSPTGVNHYEFKKLIDKYSKICFRPLQGLTIMNFFKYCHIIYRYI